MKKKKYSLNEVKYARRSYIMDYRLKDGKRVHRCPICQRPFMGLSMRKVCRECIGKKQPIFSFIISDKVIYTFYVLFILFILYTVLKGAL